MEHGVRKTLDPSLSAEDQELCENVASIFTEHGKLWERLQNVTKAKISFKKAEKWCTRTLTPGQLHQGGNNKVVRKIAHVPPGIFLRDVCVRLSKPKLPASDARISTTPQLVYCLALLSRTTSAPHAVIAMDETLDEVERSWLQTMAEEADEQNRLRSLTGKLIAEFIDDDMKEPDAIMEI
ncbi:hypothetical protein BGZ67_010481, partial [Mortierella alpina]